MIMRKLLFSLIFPAFLTLSCTNERSMESWMKDLPDDMAACKVSMPGSHDAATAGIPLDSPAREFVGTQTFMLGDQFLKGVRCFDLRPGFNPGSTDEFRIMHSVVDAGVSADEAVGAIAGMLTAHPSEFAVIVFRIENNDFTPEVLSAAKDSLSALEKKYYDLGVALDSFRPGLTVADLRGKILFINRNYLENRFWCGALASDWDEGSLLTGKHCAEQVTIDVQDDYEWENDGPFAEGKTASFVRHASAFANAGSGERWSVNHVSGYFNREGHPRPHEFAAGVMPLVNKALDAEASEGSLGMVLIDYSGDPDYEGDVILKKIVDRNFN